jgi:hypothetical protein
LPLLIATGVFTANPHTGVLKGDKIATVRYFDPNLSWGLAMGGAFVKHESI